MFSPKGEMFSEHCSGAKATVLVLKSLPKVLQDEHFAIINPSDKLNPLLQRYVFYNDENLYCAPALHCKEFTFEPRLATKVILISL